MGFSTERSAHNKVRRKKRQDRAEGESPETTDHIQNKEYG